MRSQMTIERFQDLRAAPVYSSERERIGSVEHVYYNVESNEPEWLAIGAGVLSHRFLMVPVRGASFEQDGVIVPFTKDQVKNSPDVAPDAISQPLERELWAYYGQHGDWGREYGQPADFREPATPMHEPEHQQSRIRRWNWDFTRR